MFKFSLFSLPAGVARFRLCAALAVAGLLAACAQPVKHVDYTAFRDSKPASILVLPPLNETSDVGASYGMLSQMTLPLAEAGYYVVPVAEMEETFRQNGLTLPADIQALPAEKLRKIFGADAALYTKITEYGTVYKIIDSDTVVTTSAKLVDLRTGTMLWQGSARATGKELGGFNVNGGGLIGMLANAVVTQIAHTLGDKSHDVAGLASARLLSTGQPDGLLYGPYSPKAETE